MKKTKPRTRILSATLVEDIGSPGELWPAIDAIADASDWSFNKVVWKLVREALDARAAVERTS